MAQARIADLPKLEIIDPQCYLIVEKPGYNDGTFKSTVEELQKAITVTADVITSAEGEITISIRDINGSTSASFVNPTAKVVDNGDNTSTIIIRDTSGTTTSTVVNKISVDVEPTQASPNLLTSGTIYSELAARDERIATLEENLGQAQSAIATLQEAVTQLQEAMRAAQTDISNIKTTYLYV